MKRLTCIMGLVAAVVALAALSTSPAGAQDEKEVPSIKKIMTRLHKGGDAALPTAKTAIAATPTDWEALEKVSRPLVRLSNALKKNDTPKGEQEDFVKLSDEYHQTAVALADATKAKDATAAKAAVDKLGMSCASCHKAHKP